MQHSGVYKGTQIGNPESKTGTLGRVNQSLQDSRVTHDYSAASELSGFLRQQHGTFLK